MVLNLSDIVKWMRGHQNYISLSRKKTRFEADGVTQDGNRYNQVHCRSTSRILGRPLFRGYRFGVWVSLCQFGKTEMNSVPNECLEGSRWGS